MTTIEANSSSHQLKAISISGGFLDGQRFDIAD